MDKNIKKMPIMQKYNQLINQIDCIIKYYNKYEINFGDNLNKKYY